MSHKAKIRFVVVCCLISISVFLVQTHQATQTKAQNYFIPLTWPVENPRYISRGVDPNIPHWGLDIYAATREGTPIYAAAGGSVIFHGWDSFGGGNLIKIDHGEVAGVHYYTWYAHLATFNLTADQIANGVNQGDRIGTMGCTGSCDGDHVHFQVMHTVSTMPSISECPTCMDPIGLNLFSEGSVGQIEQSGELVMHSLNPNPGQNPSVTINLTNTGGQSVVLNEAFIRLIRDSEELKIPLISGVNTSIAPGQTIPLTGFSRTLVEADRGRWLIEKVEMKTDAGEWLPGIFQGIWLIVGHENYAKHTTATASSWNADSCNYEHCLDPTRLTDDVHDGYSRWESEYYDGQWVQIDLGSDKYIDTVLIRWEAAYDKLYEVKVKSDSGSWSTVYETDNGLGGSSYIVIPPQYVRFISVVMHERALVWGDSIWELEAYNMSGAQGGPLPTDTPTVTLPTSTPTPLPTATSTPTSTPTATMTPTPTVVPTATSVPSPTPTPVPTAPDLVILGHAFVPEHPDDNDWVYLFFGQKNQSPVDEPAGLTITELFISYPGVPPEGANGDKTRLISALDGNEQVTKYFLLTSMDDGTYEMYIRADNDGEVAEWNEENNLYGPFYLTVGGPIPTATPTTLPTVTNTSTVTPVPTTTSTPTITPTPGSGLPDYSIQSCEFIPANFEPGDYFEVACTILNQGTNSATGISETELWVDSEFLSSAVVDVLSSSPPDNTDNITLIGEVDLLYGGDHSFCVETDVFNDVPESDETNNTHCFNVTVGSSSPTTTPTETAAPTETATPTGTPEPTATPVATDTPTPEPTPTNTPEPTATPVPTNTPETQLADVVFVNVELDPENPTDDDNLDVIFYLQNIGGTKTDGWPEVQCYVDGNFVDDDTVPRLDPGEIDDDSCGLDELSAGSHTIELLITGVTESNYENNSYGPIQVTVIPD